MTSPSSPSGLPACARCLRTVPRDRGFTLIELVAVVGIVLVLALLLVPIGSRAKQMSQSVQCLGNLRALGQMCVQYASDNNGCPPQAQIDKSGTPLWFEQLCAYEGRGGRGNTLKYMACPATKALPGGSYSTADGKRNYDINQLAGHSWSPAGEPASHLHVKMGLLNVGGSLTSPSGGPSKVAWFMDPSVSNSVFFSSSAARGSYVFRRDHNKKTNVLFMDGHAAAVEIPDFKLKPQLLDQQEWIDFFGAP